MRQLLLLVAMCASGMLLAAPVSKDDAQQKASRFITQKIGISQQMQAVPNHARRAADGDDAQTAPYYAFNLQGGGFVIVSGDDRTEEIIGYSATGSFSEVAMPDNMRAFLESYAEGIRYLDEHHVTATGNGTQARRATPDMTSIEPLIKTQWDQSIPYNNECPTLGTQTTYTGCVATALAQMMYYHQWPDATTAPIPAYQSTKHLFSLDEIEAGTAIDWNSMTLTYDKNKDTDAAKAVATLMKLCGQAVQMDYGVDADGGSGAFSVNIAPALINYFDYEETTTRLIERKNYDYDEWQAIVYGELKAGRPVIYGGQSKGGGHEFICDGYDQDDFFHINWGWGGSSDGYFRLRLLNPKTQGAGGSTTSDGYGMSQHVVIGIQKNDGDYVDTRRLTTGSLNVYGTTTTYNRRSATANFQNFQIAYSVYNYTGQDQAFDLSYRIVDSQGNTVKDTPETDIQGSTIGNHKGIGYSRKAISIGANLGNGNYRLVLASRVSGSDEWKTNEGSEAGYIDFTVSGNRLTVTHTAQATNLTVVSVEPKGLLETYSTVTVEYTLKNNGTQAVHTDLMFGVSSTANGNYQTSYAAFVDLESGESTTVTTDFVPALVQTYYLHLVTPEGTEIGTPYPVEIKASTAPALTVTDAKFTPEMNEENGTYFVNSTSVKAELTIKNEGGRAYNNQLTIRKLMHTKSNDIWWLAANDEKVSVNIPVNGTYTVSTELKDINKDTDLFRIEIYSVQSNGTQGLTYKTPDFELRDPNAVNVEVTEVAIAKSDEDNKTIAGNKFDITLTLKNNDSKPFTNTITFRPEGFSTVHNAWVGLSTSTDQCDIPAGGTAQVHNTPFGPMTGIYQTMYNFTLYRVLVYYGTEQPKTYNDARVLLLTDGYTFVEDSGVGALQIDGKPVKVFDLKGRQVGTSDQMETLQPGLYIVNGKKVVKQ